MLDNWSLMNPEEAISLLDAKFPDDKVWLYVVGWIAELPDDLLVLYMLQIS